MKALEVFQTVLNDISSSSGTDGITSNKFGNLMEGLGTTYFDEEHCRTIRKINDDNGMIT